MGRFTIILVVGFAIIAGLMKLNYNRIARTAEGLSSDTFTERTARSNSHSVVDLCLLELSGNHDWRSGYTNLGMAEGSASAAIIDSTSDASLGRDTVRIEALGMCGNSQVDVEALVALNALELPGGAGGGITARANVETKGTLIVDGRDHDLNASVIPNNGVKAIVTSANVFRGGTSTLGGTMDSGLDLAPTKTGYEPVIETGVTFPNGFPDTPDKVLGGPDSGYPEGTLKNVAQSGINGSQYVTDPSALTFPLSGVTYVELPAGEAWRDIDFGASSGILVVHNGTYDAMIENINYGSFTGIVITDDMQHVHNDFLGMVAVLTVGPMGGNCIGNGSGRIMYSREAALQGMGQTGIEGDNVALLSYYE
jgi:hypothetical protein